MSNQDRKSTRLDSDQFISYRLFDSEGRVCDEGMAKTNDISRTGVAVENRTAFEVGFKVELTIALSENLVKVDGVVRNVEEINENQYNIGIEFSNITDDQVKEISEEFPEILK